MKKLIDSRQYKDVLNLFDKESQVATDISLTLALKACTKLYDRERGTRIHRQLSPQSLQDPFIQTSLIHFYMQCQDVDHAHRIFSAIDRKTVFMYGAMFKGYISNGMTEKVLELFDEISVKPDEVIITLLFNACAKLANARAMKLGKDVLNRLPMAFLQHQTVANSAVDMLMKFGDVKGAEHLFEQIKRKSVVTYGAMMQGYVMNELSDKALDLSQRVSFTYNEFLYAIMYSACASLSNERAIQLGKQLLRQMPRMFLNDIVLTGSAIHMLMKFGEVDDAERLFSQMKKRRASTYGVMMNGYNLNDEPHKCLKLFQEVKRQNVTLDEPIFVSLIGACSRIGIMSICRNAIDQIPVHLQNSLRLKNSVIDMWGKAGAISEAKQQYQSISQPDVVAYTTMINAYARNGMGSEAVDFYRQMPENMRNAISQICVLNACSHSGLVDEARVIFNEITTKTEQVISTMVDCLARMFMFDEAQQLIDEYEKSNTPSVVMYTAMLSGARNHRHSALSQKLYDQMKFLFFNQKSDLITASILLSNTYSSVGEHQQAEEVRVKRIKQLGKKVKVGLSWTEVNGELVEFKAHDRSHPRSADIYAEIDRLSCELKEHGHEFDSNWVTRPLHDGESIESVLCGHSEKLAIAFNLIQQPTPTFIQITKNLRVCGDCHRATKMIAKIRQCEIIVRDANRIHHFHKNGQCSCQDHF